MGNCFALGKPNTKSLQIVKMDGKILELTAPITVSELLVNFSGLGVAVSERASHLLPPAYELKIGNTYYLLPSPSSGGVISHPSTHVSSLSTVETEQSDGMKRIKVVITNQQLQQLLSKQISVEDVVSGLDRRTCSSVDSPSKCWKPKLESILEVSE